MKAIAHNKTIFFAMALSILICLPGTGQGADVRQMSPTRKTPQPAQPVQAVVRTVISVDPKNPSLTVGGESVTVTLSGPNLNLITSVEVIHKGEVITASLGKQKPTSFTSRYVTLTALIGASPGSYQVRLVTKTKTVDIPLDVASVTVQSRTIPSKSLATQRAAPRQRKTVWQAPAPGETEIAQTQPLRAAAASGKQTMAASRIQSSPTAPSPSTGSSGSGDGVTGMSPPPSQLGTLKQPSGSAGQQDGVPAQGSGAGSGNLTEIRGAATSQSSAPTDKASGRSVPSLTSPAGVPSRQLASSQAYKVRNMSPSGEKLQPREYQPTVNRVAMSPEEKMALRRAGTIDRTQFNWVVSKVFSAASFRANSCGGTWEVRRITIDIPNTYNNNSTDLTRLDYELTDGEKESSRRKWGGARGIRDIYIKISKIRACIDDWLSNNWTGSVEGGEFKVSLPFRVSSVIKTRAIERWDKEGPWIWTDRWDWNDASADSVFQDYVLSEIVLEITLSPSISNGTVTYSGVDVRWNTTYGDFQAPLRESYWAYIPKIIDFKGAKLEEIRQRAISLFNENSVRNRISDALTEAVLSNPYVNQVTALTGGSGGVVTYGYE